MNVENAAAGLRSLGNSAGSANAAVPMRPYPFKSRVGIPAAVVLAVLTAAGWAARDSLLPATGVRVVPVVLRPVAASVTSIASASSAKPGSGGVIAQAAGWVEPDPYAVAVSALTDGVIRDVLALEGQRVRAGDVLARLIDDDAKLAVRKTEADLAAKRAALTAAQKQWDNPVERRRAVAASIGALDETRAESLKVDAEVDAERAREAELADLANRLEKLVAARATAEQELVGLRFKLDAQRATIKAAEARRPVLAALVRQKEAEVTAAQENATLRIEETLALQSGQAAVMKAEAALAEAKLRLHRTDVRSPADGVVMTRLAEPGGKLMLGMDSPHSAYVARLYDPARLQVRVDVPLADASKVGVGTPAEVTVEALPGKTLRGEVTRVVNEADLTKNTLQFKVRIIEPQDGLKPEMLARVKFLVSDKPAPTTASAVADASGGRHLPFVPERLLKRDAGAVTVMIADRGRGIAVRRTLTLTGTTHSGWVEVEAGVSAGDAIIEQPGDIADGARINVIGEADEPTPNGPNKTGGNHGVH